MSRERYAAALFLTHNQRVGKLGATALECPGCYEALRNVDPVLLAHIGGCIPLLTLADGAVAPDPLPDEPVALYGMRLFRHVLAGGLTAAFSTEQLELAAYAGVTASTAPGYSTAVYDRLSATRHTIAALIRGRLSERPTAPPVVPDATPAERPNIGPMAPLMDSPIVRPPSGTAVTVDVDRFASLDRVGFRPTSKPAIDIKF